MNGLELYSSTYPTRHTTRAQHEGGHAAYGAVRGEAVGEAVAEHDRHRHRILGYVEVGGVDAVEGEGLDHLQKEEGRRKEGRKEEGGRMYIPILVMGERARSSAGRRG